MIIGLGARIYFGYADVDIGNVGEVRAASRFPAMRIRADGPGFHRGFRP